MAAERIPYAPAKQLFGGEEVKRSQISEDYKEMMEKDMLLLAPTPETVSERYARAEKKKEDARKAMESAGGAKEDVEDVLDLGTILSEEAGRSGPRR
jgi:hypothetical protein